MDSNLVCRTCLTQLDSAKASTTVATLASGTAPRLGNRRGVCPECNRFAAATRRERARVVEEILTTEQRRLLDTEVPKLVYDHLYNSR